MEDNSTPRPRINTSSWYWNALMALACLVPLRYAIFDVVLQPDRNPYWRVACALLAPFVAYMGYTYARDAVRLRKRARGTSGK